MTRARTPRELRSFALSVGIALVALGVLLFWRGRSVAGGVVAAVGAVLAVAGLVAPARLGPVYRGWMTLALAISKVTTPLFMGIVYFVVITPIGLVMRLLGHNPIARSRTAATYWVGRTASARRSDLRRQF